MSDLDKMWAALEAHEPKRGYTKAWRTMLKKRTQDSVWGVYHSSPLSSPARNAAWNAARAMAFAAISEKKAKDAAADAAVSEQNAQSAIKALKEKT